MARKFGTNCSKCQRSTEQQQSIKCFKIHSKDLLQSNDFPITSSIFLLSSVLVFYFFLLLFSIPSFIVSLLPEFLAFCPNIFETGGAAAPPARTPMTMTTEKDKHPCDIESTLSVDQLAHLLVELGEEPENNNVSLTLNTCDSLSEVACPNEPTEAAITTDQRKGAATPVFDHKGMGLFSNNERVFSDGSQIVANLSKRLLTPGETSLLSKVLSFCPTPRDIGLFALRKDISDYVRRLRLKEYFLNNDYVGSGFSSYPAFRHRSTCCPERNRDLILEVYIGMLEKKIFSSNLKARCHRNISREEQKALGNFRNYDDIIIKQADKGSALVILDRDKYVAETMRQLNDSEVYISPRDDPTADMIRKVNERVENLHNDGYISQSTLQYLMVTNDATAGRFYLLPKIHK